MKKIVNVLVGMMFTATVTAQTDTIKEKIDNVRLELQQEQVSGTTVIHNSTIEVPTKLNNGIETRNTSGNEVQKPVKRYARLPTTDEINARAAAKLNTPQITTTTTTTSSPNSTRVRTTTSTRTDSTKASVPAKTIRKRSQATPGRTKAINTKRPQKTSSTSKP